MADIYVSLGYEEYKRFENAMDSPSREKLHSSDDNRYYHKSIRLPLGDVFLEIHGPVVKAGRVEEAENKVE